jgi:hypothetical protein
MISCRIGRKSYAHQLVDTVEKAANCLYAAIEVVDNHADELVSAG